MTPTLRLFEQYMDTAALLDKGAHFFEVTRSTDGYEEVDGLEPEYAVGPYDLNLLVELICSTHGRSLLAGYLVNTKTDADGAPLIGIERLTLEVTTGAETHVGVILKYEAGDWVNLGNLRGTAVATEDDASDLAARAFSFLRLVHTVGCTAHTATASPANPKRIAKGKKPMYEWRTVVIEPKAPPSLSKGGTHASPRHHDRRGHWVVSKLGKRYWRRATKVGNPTNGTVFHDYLVKSTNTLPEGETK